jgi:hypothetical protein
VHDGWDGKDRCGEQLDESPNKVKRGREKNGGGGNEEGHGQSSMERRFNAGGYRMLLKLTCCFCFTSTNFHQNSWKEWLGGVWTLPC